MLPKRKGHPAWNKGLHVYLGGKKFEKGQTPWNKGLKGIHLSPQSEFKKGQTSANSMVFAATGYTFKGDMKEYKRIHYQITKKLGRPMKCEECRTETASRYHWANISGEYLMDESDWKRLCVKCHYLFDKQDERKERFIHD